MYAAWCSCQLSLYRAVLVPTPPYLSTSNHHTKPGNYTLHYLAAGARSLGRGGTPSAPQHGGGVLYWNESLGLLWNANLEHSRLGSYWSCYDALTNSFAAEGLRVLAWVRKQSNPRQPQHLKHNPIVV